MKVSNYFYDSQLLGAAYTKDKAYSLSILCTGHGSDLETSLSFTDVSESYSISTRPVMGLGDLYLYETYEEAEEVIESIAKITAFLFSEYHITQANSEAATRSAFKKHFDSGLFLYHLEDRNFLGELVFAKEMACPIGPEEIWSEKWLPYGGR